ncbi:MAG: LysR family transcriptional regulator [Methylococcales bacterium]
MWPKMTLEQLKMLTMVAEQGSLRAASGSLFKSQPAISQGIKQLELQLDLQLFSRSGYRLELTEAGEHIYQHAVQLLNKASEIKQLSEHLSRGNEAKITVAIEASFDLQRILPILEKIQNEFTKTQIILKQEYLSGAFEAVQQQTADIAISPVTQLVLQSGIYESCFVYQGHLVNVAAPRLLMRHPRLKLVEELLNEYQIVVQDSGIGSKSKNYSVQSGQRCWYASDFTTKKTLILSGMGWGRLPAHEIVNELKNGSLVQINVEDIENPLALDYSVLKLKSRVLGPVASKLWKDLLLSANAP